MTGQATADVSHNAQSGQAGLFLDVPRDPHSKVVTMSSARRRVWGEVRPRKNPCDLSDEQMQRIHQWLADWKNGGREAHIEQVRQESRAKEQGITKPDD